MNIPLVMEAERLPYLKGNCHMGKNSHGLLFNLYFCKKISIINISESLFFQRILSHREDNKRYKRTGMRTFHM